jgi:nucleotide-binding universal stress UspA family protein
MLTVIDGSERAGRIIELVLNLARKGLAVEAVVLGVIPEPPDGRLRGYGSFKRKQVHARLKEVMEGRTIAAAARRLDQAGVTHKDRTEVGNPAETILRVADEEACDIVVLGDAPAGGLWCWLSRTTGLILATMAGEVAQLATLPIVIIK